MDFKTFRKNHNTETRNDNPSEEDLRKTAERYGGKSDSEMLGEIARAARRERQEGTYSDAKLDEFAANLSPMLNAEQRERLAKAIKMIKGD